MCVIKPLSVYLIIMMLYFGSIVLACSKDGSGTAGSRFFCYKMIDPVYGCWWWNYYIRVKEKLTKRLNGLKV
jgi:hypothetical protein